MPQNDAFELIQKSYQVQIVKRGAVYQESEEVISRIRSCSKWLTENRKPGLILYGGVGSGKTTLMTAINEVIRLAHYSALASIQKVVRMVNAMDMVKIAKDQPLRFESLKSCELLAIDDLGIESDVVKSWGNSLSPMTDLIYYRYDHRLFTIVTTNLDNKSLDERYDPRISDRIREMFDKVNCNAKSFRK